MTKAFLTVRREAAWWLGGSIGLLRRHPAGLLMLFGVALVAVGVGVDLSRMLVALVVSMAVALWNRLWPASFG